MRLYGPFLGLGLSFSILILFTQSVRLLGQGISPSQCRYIHRTKRAQNKQTNRDASLGLEPTISVLEQAKTVRALDRAATAIVNILLVKILLE
jgi:hypothetical protein